ncbi:mercury resistance system transport protein MerF [Hyphomonas sp.]|uniref:mercury resistance system transport protein MerF n=1 Tax=Hyphomonas sp. TaxID=87 RepID=UPI0026329914|nr:mercury resistance system transport protein MerF [Hyphomonas sp.]MDF1807549.1 mercury resistance system transport protein MerF [Hyphomonas sp.]
MNDRTILRTGIGGTVVAALCCFTPELVILLGVTGLSAWLGRLDHVPLPALAIFLAITVYAVWRRNQRQGDACCATGNAQETRQGLR